MRLTLFIISHFKRFIFPRKQNGASLINQSPDPQIHLSSLLRWFNLLHITPPPHIIIAPLHEQSETKERKKMNKIKGREREIHRACECGQTIKSDPHRCSRVQLSDRPASSPRGCCGEINEASA